MQVEEEAMTEEEYEAELAQQEAKKDANVKEVEEDILSPQEVEAMKAKIANYAPWMNVDPEARALTTLTLALTTRARRRREPRPPAARPLRVPSAECHLSIHRTAPPPPRCAGHRAREEGSRGPQERGADAGRRHAARPAGGRAERGGRAQVQGAVRGRDRADMGDLRRARPPRANG